MRYLVVVDMQKDFVDGALGTKEAQAIVPAVVEHITAAKAAGDAIFVTLDTHGPDYLQTQEGRHLPVEHCIEGTPGWQLDADVAAALQGADPEKLVTLRKPTFGAVHLPDAMQTMMDLYGVPEAIKFVGLCTGICVISNVLLTKAAFPEVPVTVDAAACACVTPESHRTALDAMQLCQVEIVNG